MRKGQSMLEYTILMIIIVAAFLTMQAYIKRGFQGRWKQGVDGMGDQYDVNGFNSSIRYTLDSSSESMLSVEPRIVNGENGLMTYREDSSTVVEKKDGTATIAPIGQ